jgi:hypothetical protein
MSASQTLQYAISRCADQPLHNLGEPFGNLLNNTPQELARLPGSPAVVMMAQCLSYLKSNYRFREPLRSDQKAFQNFVALILQTPPAPPRKDN